MSDGQRPVVGISCYHQRRAHDDAAVRAAIVEFATAPNWGNQPRYLLLSSLPGQDIPRRAGMVNARVLRATLDEFLAHQAVAALSLWSARTDSDRGLSVRRNNIRDTAGLISADRPGNEPSVDAWVAAATELFDRVEASSGVIPVFATASEIGSECSEVAIGMPGGGVAHPYPDELARIAEHRRYLGTRYMRFPRWGTLVGHAHVAALGGVEAIARAVMPALVRPLAGGVYFQLTEHVATAMGDDALAKQRAFHLLAAPLLPPATHTRT